MLYTSPNITPDQQSLLDGRNSHQYPAERELSGGKINILSSDKQGEDAKSSENAEGAQKGKSKKGGKRGSAGREALRDGAGLEPMAESAVPEVESAAARVKGGVEMSDEMERKAADLRRQMLDRYKELNWHLYQARASSARRYGQAPKLMSREEFMDSPQALRGYVEVKAEELQQLGAHVGKLFETLEFEDRDGNVAAYEPEETYGAEEGIIGRKFAEGKAAKGEALEASEPEGEHGAPEADVRLREADAYKAAKELVETAIGKDNVVEVGRAEAAGMLGHKATEAQLMGSRTDRKMAEVAEYYADKELDENQRKVVDVFAGKADNLPIEVSRPEGRARILMRQGGEKRAGTKHSLFRHFNTVSSNITFDDILLIPEILSKGERSINGSKISYDYVTGDGTRLRVTTEIRKNNREEFTNFISNRKPLQTEYRQAQEGNTQSSARTTDAEVSGAKVGNSGETAKFSIEKTSACTRLFHLKNPHYVKKKLFYSGGNQGQ